MESGDEPGREGHLGVHHALRLSDEESDRAARERRIEPSYRDEATDSAKRQRPSPTDTEDELLETAGVPVKRFRDQ